MDKAYPQYLGSSMEGTVLPAGTMVERLLQHEKNQPDKVVYILLEDGLTEKESITYASLVRKAKAIATVLMEKGSKGDRVLLLFPTGIAFITAFFACHFAGMIAVPAYPPKRNKSNERFRSIVQDSSPAFLISTAGIHAELLEYHSTEGYPEGMQMLVYEELDESLAGKWSDPGISAGDIALLQYTSGSTGTPNGVMVSHANIIHNSECIKQSFGFDENSVGVNWLPNFHDMGLIGCLIQAAYLGASNVIIPPLSFLKNPSNWFRAMSRYGATTGGGPNFAFDYSIEKVPDEDIPQFDLGGLRTLYCGAEPIRRETLQEFAAKFKPSGFRPAQFYPCYGMAESVLIVTGGNYLAAPLYTEVDARTLEENRVLSVTSGRESRVLTACGYPWLGMRVAIVDPVTRIPSAAGMLGEVWVSGPSVAQGYWNKPQETEETFSACIAGTHDGPWLRTGDLGFISHGQLFISGRRKDLIIIRGANYFPNDIEHCAEGCHPAIRKNASAAFSIDSGEGEKLVLVMETERAFMNTDKHDEVFEAARQAIFSEYGIQPHALSLIRTGSILKTSSGKIQRFAVKRAWQENELKMVASWKMPAITDELASEIGFRPGYLREWLIHWISQKLKVDPGKIDPDKAVSAYGLDSITAVSLERDVNKEFGIEWPIESFMKENTVNMLVEEGINLLKAKKRPSAK
jgi:acyl-CoA synthetase (AMP-forming)/AMP-acid ligase II/acyl carrier protein